MAEKRSRPKIRDDGLAGNTHGLPRIHCVCRADCYMRALCVRCCEMMRPICWNLPNGLLGSLHEVVQESPKSACWKSNTQRIRIWKHCTRRVRSGSFQAYPVRVESRSLQSETLMVPRVAMLDSLIVSRQCHCLRMGVFIATPSQCAAPTYTRLRRQPSSSCVVVFEPRRNL
jgi:hypothetical protein